MAGGWTKGKPQTPESNRKRSETLKGRTLSKRHRIRIGRGVRASARRRAEAASGGAEAPTQAG